MTPLYQKVKTHILARIMSGEWISAQRVLSEQEIVQEFNVSRMTANRALRELSAEGYLVRVAGVGTFVADIKARSHPLEIHNIAEEIRLRGHPYSAKVIQNSREAASALIAKEMELSPRTPVFHSLVVHYENDSPIQLEERYVNQEVVPQYGTIDFTKITPNEYLMKVAPLQEVEHIVQAIMPEQRVAKYLHMAANEACLLLKRRTWANNKIATLALLYHPGSRYELSGRFKP